jgi:hypothetical protein
MSIMLVCRPTMTANDHGLLPAEPHYKSIFIYGRSQHVVGWQQTDCCAQAK